MPPPRGCWQERGGPVRAWARGQVSPLRSYWVGRWGDRAIDRPLRSRVIRASEIGVGAAFRGILCGCEKEALILEMC